MPSKPLIGLLTIGIVALATWSLGLMIGTAILDKDGWSDWRHAHAGLYFLIWGVSVVVITLPLLWVIGTKLAKHYEVEEAEIAASKGVGRIAARALQGKKDAKERLVELLDDETVQIRCQAARALMMLSEDWTNRELERKIRYWPGNDKLALIENLRSTHDMRATWILEMLAADRNPAIARRARSALAWVAPKTTRMDGTVRKEKAKADRRAEKKGLRPAGASADGMRMGDEATPPKMVDKREAPPRRSTPLQQPSASAKPAPKQGAKSPAARPSEAGDGPGGNGRPARPPRPRPAMGDAAHAKKRPAPADQAVPASSQQAGAPATPAVETTSAGDGTRD
jgi:hypothetical protein